MPDAFRKASKGETPTMSDSRVSEIGRHIFEMLSKIPDIFQSSTPDPIKEYSIPLNTPKAERLKIAGQEKLRADRELLEVHQNLGKWLKNNAHSGSMNLNPPASYSTENENKLDALIESRNRFVEGLNSLDENRQKMTDSENQQIDQLVKPQIDYYNQQLEILHRNIYGELLRKYLAQRGDLRL